MHDGAFLALAAKGILIAALALLYVWRSHAPDKFQKLALVTAFLTFDLIVLGGFTRLTDSGLGCPDWPGCYGHSDPLSAGEPIRAAESAQPTGPVTMGKAWVEMVHRYFALGVGVLIVVLVALAWWRWLRDRSRPAKLATVAFLWVCLQGAFGAWTVTQKLQPAIVTAHLLGGMTLLALLVWLALRENRAPPVAGAASLRGVAAFALVILVLQIALGGWVSSNYAVMACPDFPVCHGVWMPPDLDFANGFTLWRSLGMTGGESARPIPFQALVAIHWVHRVFAIGAAIVLGWLAWRASGIQGTRRSAKWLAWLVIVQLLSGMSNVIFQWPLLLAVIHNGGAAALLAVVVGLNYRAWQAQTQSVRVPNDGATARAAG
ncbi:MAG TPA: COX15/CtaA family protein [Burkholderiaceae bacterium]|nr:COX15/CtaA family protein [Burkholderiaceae bacterium]